MVKVLITVLTKELSEKMLYAMALEFQNGGIDFIVVITVNGYTILGM